MTGRRKRVDHAGSAPNRRSATPDFERMLKESEERYAAENALLAQALEGGAFYGVDPLASPQHKRALRESSRAAIKEVVAKWLALGASPGDLADHLEGARVEMADEARKRGRQG